MDVDIAEGWPGSACLVWFWESHSPGLAGRADRWRWPRRAGGDSKHAGWSRHRGVPTPGERPQGRPLAGGDSNGTMALVTSPSGSAQWLYLIDTKSRAFAIYRVDPTNPKGSSSWRPRGSISGT